MPKLPPQVLQTLSKDINLVCDLAFRQAGAEPLQPINRISSGFAAVVKFVDDAAKALEEKSNPPSDDSQTTGTPEEAQKEIPSEA